MGKDSKMDNMNLMCSHLKKTSTVLFTIFIILPFGLNSKERVKSLNTVICKSVKRTNYEHKKYKNLLVFDKRSNFPIPLLETDKPYSLKFKLKIEQINSKDSCGIELVIVPLKKHKLSDTGCIYKISEINSNSNWTSVEIQFYVPSKYKAFYIEPKNSIITIDSMEITVLKSDNFNLVTNPNFDIFSLLPRSLHNGIKGLFGWWKFNNLNCIEQREQIHVDYRIDNQGVTENPVFHYGTPDFVIESIQNRNINCSGRLVCYTDGKKPKNGCQGEYLQTQLIKQMERGRKYKISFDYRIDDYSRKGSNSLGFRLTKCPLNPMDKIMFETNIPPVPTGLVSDSVVLNTEWMRYEFVYEAVGGEQFFTIGKFSKNGKIRVQNLPINKKNRNNYVAAYLIDNISITEI